MKTDIEFLVGKIQLSEQGQLVEIDTTIRPTSSVLKKEGIHRQYCNFVIHYDEYVQMHLKVGDCISVDIKKIRPKKTGR